MPNTINADNGVVSGITGIRTTADNTGNLALQSNGVTLLTATTANTLSVSNVATLSISGATSGAVSLAVPAVAGTNTVTIAAQTGTLNAAGPAFSAYANATQTVTLATSVKIAIDTEFFDTNSCFDTTLNRFTPTVAGYYQVNGVLRGSVATVFSGIALLLWKNGAVFRRGGEINGTLTANQNVQVVFSEVIYLNGTTDYLEFYGALTGTGTATFQSANPISTSAFSASLVRGA